MNRIPTGASRRHHLAILAAFVLLGLSVRPLRAQTTQPQGGIATPAAALPGGDSPELMLFQEMPVVVAAGKREQTQQAAPASVSVIDADDIELFGYRSVADVLRDQRSFYLHTDGLNWFAGVRGFLRPGEWNARLLVTVDGSPTREVVFGQTHIDRDFVLPLEAVKQIEIVRGPGSALYGDSAVFGVVNVVTKDGADINGFQVKGTGGTDETGRVAVLYGKSINDWDVLAGVTGYSSQGDNHIHYAGVNDPQHNFGNINGYDYEGVASTFLKAHKGDFTVQLDLATRQKDNRAATYNVSFFDPGNMYEQRANLRVRFDHEISEGQSIHALAYYGYYGYAQNYILPAAAPLPAFRYFTEAHDDWLGQEVHYDLQANKSLHLMAGVDAVEAIDTHQRDHDESDGTIFQGNQSYNSWGLFAEGDLKFTDWLSFTAGVRTDITQRVGTDVSPRAAIVANATKNDTLKALYGRAFRSPNLYEQFYNVPGNSPNPNLKPEICDTFEGVWEHQCDNGWRTTLDGFIWKMNDAMDNFILPDGNLQTQNGPTLWAHGAEFEIQKQWKNGARLRAFGTYTRAEHDGIVLPHSPKWIVGSAAAVPLFGRETFVAVEPQIVGPMRSDLNQYTSPTFITNVVFTSRDLVKGWTFQAGIYDLFAGGARFPRDGAFNQFQPTLNWPGTRLEISVSTKF